MFELPESGAESPARVCIGDLIALACEEALALTGDEEEAAHLAAIAVSELLATPQNRGALRRLEATSDPPTNGS